MERPVFKPEFYRELAEENPFGLTLNWHEVEAWFNFIAWPVYKTYIYKNHKTAVRRWWARAHLRELERAREAMENARYERAQAEQDALPTEELTDIPHNATIFKIFGGKSDG